MYKAEDYTDHENEMVRQLARKNMKLCREINVLNERIEMMCRMYGATYDDALEFKEQRDKLLEKAKNYISTLECGAPKECVNNQKRILNETISKIEGEAK